MQRMVSDESLLGGQTVRCDEDVDLLYGGETSTRQQSGLVDIKRYSYRKLAAVVPAGDNLRELLPDVVTLDPPRMP
jgi:hypothetical protein